MKAMLKVLVVCFTALTFGGVGVAAEKAEKAVKEKTTTVTGEVTSVDPKTGQLNVKVKEKEMMLTADTKAKNDLEKVKVGDRVRVTYSEKNGKMMATAVKADTKPKAEKKTDLDRKAGKKTP